MLPEAPTPVEPASTPAPEPQSRTEPESLPATRPFANPTVAIPDSGPHWPFLNRERTAAHWVAPLVESQAPPALTYNERRARRASTTTRTPLAEREPVAGEEPQPARREGFDVPDDILEVPSFLRDS